MLVISGEVTVIAPREFFESEIENPVEIVQWDTHIESGLGGDQTGSACFLHDG